jgi:2-iminobutanoate/2-iminopropanoate deaminase
MKRKSVYSEGFSHKNPIPAACQLGNMLYSGSIQGTDPVTGEYGKTIDEQCSLMFDHVKRIIQASGASTDNIIKMTVWMKDRSQRAPLNKVWLEVFPDEISRPARHTMQAPLDGEKLIECDFIAVTGV